MYAEVVSVGNTSMVIHVEAWSQPGRFGERKRVSKAKFKFVALDEQGRPTPVTVLSD